MPDFGQFPDPRTHADRQAAAAEAKEFYGDAPRTIKLDCGATGHLDMDGLGYRCHDCLTVVGSAACPCR